MVYARKGNGPLNRYNVSARNENFMRAKAVEREMRSMPQLDLLALMEVVLNDMIDDNHHIVGDVERLANRLACKCQFHKGNEE